MDIRKKLTILFLILIASLIVGSSLVVYLWFAEYRQSEFYVRLDKKAKSVAKLLIDVDEVDVNLLRKIEATEPISLINDRLIIYDEKDSIIYSAGKPILAQPKSTIDSVRIVKEVRFSRHSEEFLAFYFKGRLNNAVVFIAAKDIYGLSKLNKLGIILFIVSCSSIFFIYIFGLFFVERAFKPVVTIVNQIDKISVTNLSQRLDEGNRKDVIAQLAITFNKMLERLEKSFMMQKVFIANASHELKTPLTIITSQLEIGLQKKRSNEEYVAIMNSVLEDIIDVNHLANKLLLIAQTSSGFEKIEKTNIRIDEIIWDVRLNIKKTNTLYQVNVIFDESMVSDDNLTTLGNYNLMKMAFFNLAENACKYSPDKTVTIAVEIQKNNIHVIFKDNGVGIAPEDFKMIYEPFFRGKNTIGIRGHGIGLPLVNEIVKGHKGQLFVESSLGVGSKFSVSLPLVGKNKTQH